MIDKRDLSGFWFGRYVYPWAGEPSVSFLANLLEQGGSIAGTITEPNTIGASSKELRAIVSGARAAENVSFSKLYDGESDAAHAVQYEGVVDREGKRLTGTWMLEGLTGSFAMWREQIVEAEIDVAVSADV